MLELRGMLILSEHPLFEADPVDLATERLKTLHDVLHLRGYFFFEVVVLALSVGLRPDYRS